MRHLLYPNFQLARLGYSRGSRLISFLLLEEFTDDQAAPVETNRTAVPGPGNFVYTQTGGQYARLAGLLEIPAGGALGTQGLVTTSAFVCSAGFAFFVKNLQRDSGVGVITVFMSDTQVIDESGNTDSIRFDNTANISVKVGGYGFSGADTGTGIGNTLPVHFGFVVRDTGVDPLFIYKNVTTGQWKILISGNRPLTSKYLGLGSAASPGDTSRLAAGNLINAGYSVWSGFNLSTFRQADGVPVGTTWTHPSDCIIIATFNNSPTAGQYVAIRFRIQDINNYWEVRCGNSTNFIRLFEVVGGVATQRATVGILVDPGDRVQIVCDAAHIGVWFYEATFSGGRFINYTTATNFSTETDAELNLSPGDVVEIIEVLPRILSGDAVESLERLVTDV